MATLTRPAAPLRDDGAYVFHHPPKFMWGEPPRAPHQWNDYTIYLHVPYCRAICTFCTFERKQFDKEGMAQFAAGLARETGLRQRHDDFSQGRPYAVYLGGGTASLLPPAALATFLEDLHRDYGVGAEVECTLECEPGTMRFDDFVHARQAGINRIAIGVQAFDDAVLQSLNRHHKVRHVLQMIDDATAAGIDNIHIDLMYGLPGQTFDGWAESVRRAASLGITHLSAYQLIVFGSEHLDRALRTGAAPARPDADTIVEMREYAKATFATAGLVPYSLTDFARPGRECRYVVSNWNGSDYLGFGVAAYSRCGNDLWMNTVFHGEYTDATARGDLPTEKGTVMTPRERLARDLAMGLCLLQVDLDRIETSAGATLADEFAHEARELEEDGFLARDGRTLTLTPRGIRYATHVMKRFTETHSPA